MQETKLFKALSSKTRLRMLGFIKNHNECICCDVAEYVKKDVSTTFRHLEILEKVNLIKTRKEGRKLICSLKNKQKINNLLRMVRSF